MNPVIRPALFAFFMSAAAIVLQFFPVSAMANSCVITKPVLISEREAIDRYDLRRLLYTYDRYAGNRQPDSDATVGVVEGDLCISGDLLLDDSTHLQKLFSIRARHPDDLVYGAENSEAGLIVTGNLRTGGAIINANINGGPFLLVQGETAARAIYGGGAELHFHGKTVVEDVVIGEYNDGSLVFDRGLSVPVVVSGDHWIKIKGPSPPVFNLRFAGTKYADPGVPGSWSEFVHSDLAGLARVPEDDEDNRMDIERDLLPRVRAGQLIVDPAFRRSVRAAP